MNRRANLPMPAPQIEVRQLGMREILTVIIRRRWIILCVAVPIIVAATYGTISSSDTITASGRVVIETREPEALSYRTGTVNYDVIMSTAAQVAMSVPVASYAAASLMDTLPAFQRQFPELAGIQTEGQLRDVLLGGVNCHQVGESNILQISFNHTNPYFALIAADALMKAYISYSITSRQNIPAISYYTDQINQVTSEIDSLLGVQAGILMKAGYSAFEDNAKATSAQIVQMERSYFSIRADRIALEAKLDGMLQAVMDDNGYMPVSREGDNWNIVDLKKRLDSQLTDLSKLRLQYNDDSEWVQRHLQLIADTREQLYHERNNYFHHLGIEIEQLKKKETDYLAAIEQQKQYLEVFPHVRQEVDTIELSIETQMDLLESLQIKRGEVRLKAGTDQRVSNIIPLNQPSINMVVAGSKKMLYLLLATLFGVALGLLAALFAENQDHRLYEKRQVQQYLELPVLGSITRTNANGE
ncbi:MAG: hypothetical protein AMJ53_17135 [Gammaproteobacteria bacterium SG8_11]|nr:MAG: hypothetical protein AMJ53_17135 [Gammaproteobacteria bacterium SG8_11]